MYNDAALAFLCGSKLRHYFKVWWHHLHSP